MLVDVSTQNVKKVNNKGLLALPPIIQVIVYFVEVKCSINLIKSAISYKAVVQCICGTFCVIVF